MSQRFFISIGAAFFAILALGFAAVLGVSTVNEPARVVENATPVVPAAMAPGSTAETTPPLPQPMAGTPALRDEPSPQYSTVRTDYTVQDSDIGQLANAVKLGGPASGDVGKEVWARETPIAEKLLQGLSDCDQRNWLKHFVQTGHEAISGAHDYGQSVQELATLRRGNSDLAKTQIFQ